MTTTEAEVRQQISGGAFWSYAANIADRVIRFLVLIVIARLVKPTDFGVVVLSLLVVETLQIFVDAGLGGALIQDTAATDAEFDSAFLFINGMGLLISAIVFFGADGFAHLVRQPEAAGIIRVLAVLPLINALGAVHTSRIFRDMGFKALGGRTVAASLVASVVAVAMAWWGMGLWALVVRSILVALGQTVGAWIVLPWMPRLRWDSQALKRILPTGLRLLGAGLVQQIDARGIDFFAGLVLGAQALGALRIAGQTVLMLIELTAGPLTYVGYTALSRHQKDEGLFRHAFEFMSRVSALLIFPAFFGLFAVGDELFPLMFGARWAGASHLIPLLCALCVPVYFRLMTSAALFAVGRSDRILHLAIFEAICTLVLSAIGARFGLIGLVAMASARLYCLIPVGLFWLRRDAKLDPGVLWRAALPSAAASALMTAVVYGVKLVLGPYLAPAPRVAVAIGLGLLLYGAMLPLIAGPVLKEAWAWRTQKRDRQASSVS